MLLGVISTTILTFGRYLVTIGVCPKCRFAHAESILYIISSHKGQELLHTANRQQSVWSRCQLWRDAPLLSQARERGRQDGFGVNVAGWLQPTHSTHILAKDVVSKQRKCTRIYERPPKRRKPHRRHRKGPPSHRIRVRHLHQRRQTIHSHKNNNHYKNKKENNHNKKESNKKIQKKKINFRNQILEIRYQKLDIRYQILDIRSQVLEVRSQSSPSAPSTPSAPIIKNPPI